MESRGVVMVNKENLVNERIVGFDIVKALAMLFVVLLHVNGYCKDLKFESYSQGSQTLFYIIEAIAYPAIHLFVLAGSYFMIMKKPSLKQYLKLYFPMWIVTMIGMIIIGIVKPEWLSVEASMQCVFPFFGRAYWFVSEYMVLMLLSPILNGVLKCLEKKVLIVGVLALTLYVSVFPTLQFYNWNGSSLDLFILLYLYVGLIQKLDIKGMKKIGLCVWSISCVGLISSVYLIKLFAQHIDFFKGREMQFYSYYSVPVIAMALSLFILFKEIRIKNQKVIKVFSLLSGSSLVTYMYHMHPIFKLHYTEAGIFNYINVDKGMDYLCGVLLTGIIVVGGGILLNFMLTWVVSSLINWLYMKVQKGLQCTNNR